MKKNMKEQDLRDFFHDYRPEIGDNDEFMQRLTKQMDAEDAKQQQRPADPPVVLRHNHVLPRLVGLLADGHHGVPGFGLNIDRTLFGYVQHQAVAAVFNHHGAVTWDAKFFCGIYKPSAEFKVQW